MDPATDSTISYLSAAVLGAIQGFTEFLPISSSGHLALAEHMGIATGNLASLSFDLILHFATTLVVLKVFWKDLRRAIVYDRRLLFYMFVGSIPAGICGVFFNHQFRTLKENPVLVCFALCVTAVFLVVCDRAKSGNKRAYAIGVRNSFTVGLCQALALTPGISRSGLTITGGVMVGLERKDAVSFSFLLMLPAVWGAMFYELLKHRDEISAIAVGPAIVGFITAVLCGYAALKALTYLAVKGKLFPFAIYCAVVGISGLVYFGFFH